MTSQIVLSNRRGGPECVASREEREAVVRGYAALAGFTSERVNATHRAR
jgi:hypothetical protein